MNKFKKSAKVMLLTGVLSVLSAAVLWMWIAPAARAQSKSPEAQSGVASIKEVLPGLASINQAFRAVKESASVGDRGQTPITNEASVRALSDAVLQDFGLDDLPKEITEEAKERLVAAEIDYRNGRGGAIAETSVVRLIGELATAWRAPAYSRTNQLELHQFRVHLVPLMPDLASRDSSKLRSLIGTDMSPLEATYITLLLIEQKTINPAYQLTPQEKAKQGKPKPSKGTEPESFVSVQDDRGREMGQLMADVEKQVEGMKPANAASMISQALDTLGVAKAKAAQQ